MIVEAQQIRVVRASQRKVIGCSTIAGTEFKALKLIHPPAHGMTIYDATFENGSYWFA
jgi:hypothetical protein